MKAIKSTTSAASALILALVLTGCAGMSTQEKNTAIGAGTGAVAGAILTGGSTVGTVLGGAAGGVIGSQVK